VDSGSRFRIPFDDFKSGSALKLEALQGHRHPLAGDDLNRSVVVAMITMRMMQPAIHEVVNMIAMWDGVMSAVWAMNMARLMPCVTKLRGATVRIRRAYIDGMLFDEIARLVVQMPVMQVVDMIAVFDCNMAA